jgi:hypothetical protein
MPKRIEDHSLNFRGRLLMHLTPRRFPAIETRFN